MSGFVLKLAGLCCSFVSFSVILWEQSATFCWVTSTCGFHCSCVLTDWQTKTIVKANRILCIVLVIYGLCFVVVVVFFFSSYFLILGELL